MEIDFTELNVPKRSALIGSVSLAIILILGLVGWIVLPDRVLTWTEWQVIQQSLAYRQELRILTRNANRLAEILESSPDPVRAQLVTEKVHRQLHQMELASLDTQREALTLAADTIEAWSRGTLEKEEAINALQEANIIIQRAIQITEHE